MKKKSCKLFILVFLLITVICLPNVVNADNRYLSNFIDFSWNGEEHAYFSVNDDDGYCIEPGKIANNSTPVNCQGGGTYENASVLCGISMSASNGRANIATAIYNCLGGGCETNCSSVGVYGTSCNNNGSIQFGTISSNKFTLTSDEKYYISSAIPISYSGILTNYSISLTNQLTGTFIVDSPNKTETNAMNLSQTQTANTIYIKIPVSSVTTDMNMTLTINSSATYTCSGIRTTAEYCAGNGSSYQDVIIPSISPYNTTGTKEDSKQQNFIIEVGELQISKYDSVTHNLLGNVEFLLYESDCQTLAKHSNRTAIGKIITSQAGLGRVQMLLYGNYCLKETKTLATHIIGVIPNITLNTDPLHIEIENTPITIVISKKSITGSDELPGATIKITDEYGNQYKEFVSSTTPTEFIFEKGTYILTETIAPKGYMPVTNSFKFNINEQGEITVLSSNDEHYVLDGNKIIIKDDTNKIYISKKDVTNVDELPGATINVKCDNGFDFTFVSGSESKAIEATSIINSTCTLTETIAPEGYEKLKNSLKFKIDSNGNVQSIGSSDKAYYLESNRITIYNGNFPDTGLVTWIGTGIIGGALITGGVIIITRNIRKKKFSY